MKWIKDTSLPNSEFREIIIKPAKAKLLIVFVVHRKQRNRLGKNFW